MKYENIILNNSNRVKGADRLILLTLEKGQKLKAQGEALCELVAEKAAAIIQSNGTTVESGAKSTRKLVWISKGGAEYPITCTTTTKAGSVNWKETAKLYEDLLKAHGIEVPTPRYNASTTSTLTINGSAEEAEGYVGGTFDGLRKLLSGTENELTATVSLKTSAELDDNYNAFLDEMDSFISILDGTPSMLLMNRSMLVKLRSIARRAGYYERNQDDFGRTVETYAGVPMVDMGQYFDGDEILDVIATEDGKTAIYAVSLGLDGFHGISPQGNGVIQSYMPDLSAPGAVKTGEVELVAGVALKNTLKAAVLQGITIGE